MKTSRISKIAGFGLLGFVAAAVVADKANLAPLASQVAGFAGAFVGTLVGRRRRAWQRAEDASDVDRGAGPPPPTSKS